MLCQQPCLRVKLGLCTLHLRCREELRERRTAQLAERTIRDGFGKTLEVQFADGIAQNGRAWMRLAASRW